MNIKDARTVLNIPKSTPEDEVRKVYKTLAKKWHPDISKLKNANTRMQEINQAFEIVMKEGFGIIDVWEDYQKWWYKQFAEQDPIWGNGIVNEEVKKIKTR